MSIISVDTINPRQSGVAVTFSGSLDVDNDIQVSGASTLGRATGTELKITGITTFAGGDIQIDGSAAGVSSVTWDASADSLIFKDGSYAKFGDSSDLSIYHDGNDSRITQTSGSVGNLMITNSRSDELGGIFIQGWTGENGITVMPHSHVNLYFDNSLKLSTSGLGVTVTGTLDADELNISGVTTFNSTLKMTAPTSFFGLPSLTTTERDNLSGVVAGAMIWNETASNLQYYNGSAWRSVNNSAA